MKTIRSIICTVLAPVALAFFTLSQTAEAVDPAPDGGYPGENTAEGEDALFSLTSGIANTAIGFNALYSLTDGYSNTAVGDNALRSNVNGVENTAVGKDALYSNIATENTAVGLAAMYSNTTGEGNAALGDFALASNTTAFFNTAVGSAALIFNTTGQFNTAIGAQAMYSNTGGFYNTATGYYSLQSNSTGQYNTANGMQDLSKNTAGNFNTAMGRNALQRNTTGSNNTALGNAAGILLTTGSNNIDIGNPGVAAESNTMRIGTVGNQTATYMAGISGATVAGGVGVIIDTAGHLGTVVSSARFKDEIKPMDKASEAILALKPVTFRYKKELDPQGISQFGLVAEDVEKVNRDLVARDDEGKPYSVRYDAVNAMLLNEFLKEYRKNEEQEATIEHMQKQIEALTAGLQKVSAQLELSKAAPKTVSNNH